MESNAMDAASNIPRLAIAKSRSRAQSLLARPWRGPLLNPGGLPLAATRPHPTYDFLIAKSKNKNAAYLAENTANDPRLIAKKRELPFFTLLATSLFLDAPSTCGFPRFLALGCPARVTNHESPITNHYLRITALLRQRPDSRPQAALTIILNVTPATSRRALRKWLIIAAGGAAVACCVAAMVTVVVYRHNEPRLHQLVRQEVEMALRAQFKSDVEFTAFHVSVYPRIHLVIEGLTLHHQGRTDIPPIIQVRRAIVDASPAAFWSRREISKVQVDGLEIHMPPRVPGGPPLIPGTSTDLAKKYRFVIDEMDANDALIVMLRKPQDADKEPIQFALHQLVMHSFSFDRPATFQALLTNPKPVGEIDCDGKFGPWEGDVPSETPVSGSYTFRNADLSTLKGLSGTLSSQGTFSGPLAYLAVDGATDTPNFALRTSAHPMMLHTDFSAIVDGTNGNTILKNVTAKFLNSTLVTSGAVVDMYPNVKGRTIVLDAVSNHARVEDLLALAVKSGEPVMTGAAKLKVRIVIPEKNEDLVDRLQLDGLFGLSDVHFTSDAVQAKVDTLSRKGQGQPKDADISDVNSNLDGRFTLANSEMSFSNLAFDVEGADVTLGGNYNLDSGYMDFRGKLELDAKLSQTMTGWKSVMLRPFDHFFKDKDRGSGSEIPIKIVGTRQHLSFGTDFHDKDHENGDSNPNPAQIQNASKENAKLAAK